MSEYETYTSLETSRLLGLLYSYRMHFHIVANPGNYRDDPTVLSADYSGVVHTNENGVVGYNYWSDPMQSMMAQTIPRIDAMLDEAFTRAAAGELSVRDGVYIDAFAADVDRFLDGLMEGPPSCLGDILFNADEMCHRLNL